MTKAAAALLLNQDNDFASLVWKTVVENDYDGFLRALDDAGLAVGDLTLSQQEFDNMIKGVKPSGELDLAVWTGYYEVADGKSLDPLAFLILPSSPTTVYWGSRSDIMNAPKKCAVKYSLSSDAKLELATSLHGRVSIQFTRQYQEASDTVASSFTVCIIDVNSGHHAQGYDLLVCVGKAARRNDLRKFRFSHGAPN